MTEPAAYWDDQAAAFGVVFARHVLRAMPDIDQAVLRDRAGIMQLRSRVTRKSWCVPQPW